MPASRPGILVQARLNSRRLPGKVLGEVAGRPLLAYLLDRLEQCRTAGPVVVATSREPGDDPIARFCEGRGQPVFRGSLDDVAGRMLHAAEARELDAFVRVSADSPLLDPAIVDRVVDRFATEACDLATNVFPRSFPIGQSVEVVSTAALRALCGEMHAPDDREHVTRAFYSDPSRWRIVNVTGKTDLSHVRFSVDTADDAAHVAAMLQAMDRPHWQYPLADLMRLHESVLQARQR